MESKERFHHDCKRCGYEWFGIRTSKALHKLQVALLDEGAQGEDGGSMRKIYKLTLYDTSPGALAEDNSEEYFATKEAVKEFIKGYYGEPVSIDELEREGEISLERITLRGDKIAGKTKVEVKVPVQKLKLGGEDDEIDQEGKLKRRITLIEQPTPLAFA
jgi:hypothetical protein